MKDFDELLKMSDDEKLGYLQSMVEDLATQHKRPLEILASQARIRKELKKYDSNPALRSSVAYDMMIEEVRKLSVALQQFGFGDGE